MDVPTVGEQQDDTSAEGAFMGTVLLVGLAAIVIAMAAARMVCAGRREAQAEKARLVEEAGRQARRSLETVWAMHDRQFEEFVAGLCRRDGCTDVKRVGGAGDLGADVSGRSLRPPAWCGSAQSAGAQGAGIRKRLQSGTALPPGRVGSLVAGR
ncbi:restriction endonuclease [Streptomyces sp. SLBN-115]|uniref:restriction endonuclease n=1 Tax=Streptomyces sp. SLBN-115 TaxID=2768453 RepID=UPI002E15A2B1